MLNETTSDRLTLQLMNSSICFFWASLGPMCLVLKGWREGTIRSKWEPHARCAVCKLLQVVRNTPSKEGVLTTFNNFNILLNDRKVLTRCESHGMKSKHWTWYSALKGTLSSPEERLSTTTAPDRVAESTSSQGCFPLRTKQAKAILTLFHLNVYAWCTTSEASAGIRRNAVEAGGYPNNQHGLDVGECF